MLNRKPIKTLVGAALSAILSSQVTYAGSFSLYTESSGAADGNYGAGIAAEAADASTGWYNPAGLSLLHKTQMVYGGAGVFPTSKISGASIFTTVGVDDYIQSFQNLSGGKSGFVPSFHYAHPLGDNATFGFSIVAPFGLSTQWSAFGPVRYEATDSELITVNMSPEIGAKVTEHVALGLGIDVQYARVKFNQVLGSPAYLQALADADFPVEPFSLDSLSYNKGDSYALGFHAGILTMFNQNHTRIGLNYQSQMEHKFHGYSRLSGVLATPDLNVADPDSIITANTNAVFRNDQLSSNEIKLPAIVTLSGYQDVNNRLALLASVVYTQWHSLNAIVLNNVSAYAPGFGQVTLNSDSILNYRNSWRGSLGANYRCNEQWLLRAGIGYDETPTNNRDRDVRIADADRWALSVGTHYQARPNIGIDLGYTHLFSTGNVPINKTMEVGEGSTFTVNASASGSADIIGAQLVWQMDK